MNSLSLFPVEDLSFRRLFKPSGDTKEGSAGLFGVLGDGLDGLDGPAATIGPSESFPGVDVFWLFLLLIFGTPLERPCFFLYEVPLYLGISPVLYIDTVDRRRSDRID